jgi:hypothetical protein
VSTTPRWHEAGLQVCVGTHGGAEASAERDFTVGGPGAGTGFGVRDSSSRSIWGLAGGAGRSNTHIKARSRSGR